MTAPLSVLERIKKLLNHSESATALGSAAEAAAFAAKATALLLEHKLEMSDVQFEEEKTAEPVEQEALSAVETLDTQYYSASKRAAPWLEKLASALCKAHFCHLLISERSSHLWFVGRSSDRAIALYLFQTLAREGERLAVRYYHSSRKEARLEGRAYPENPKRSFLLGYAEEVARRLRERRQEVVQTAGSTALVRINSAEQDVQDYIQELNVGFAKPRNVGVINRDGLAAGRRAGSQVSLEPGIAETTTATKGNLHKGRHQLGS